MNEKNTFRTITHDNFTVQFGMQQIGTQLPYFIITAEEKKEGRIVAGGCMHDTIREVFPDLEELIQWHLCFATGEPIHYIANAQYWLDLHRQGKDSGIRGQTALEVFKKHIRFGVVRTDVKLLPLILNGVNPENWLTKRLPYLQKAFSATMTKFNIEMIQE